MKVYGGMQNRNGKQWRCVAAVKNQKELAALSGDSLHAIRKWWAETGNKVELTAAHARPGVLLYAPDTYGGLTIADYMTWDERAVLLATRPAGGGAG